MHTGEKYSEVKATLISLENVLTSIVIIPPLMSFSRSKRRDLTWWLEPAARMVHHSNKNGDT